jgi:hypothetical protein
MSTLLSETRSIREQSIFCIPIKSDRSSDIYHVQMTFNSELNKFDLDCTCRLKFGLASKRKCKHIARCVHSMMMEYSKLNNTSKELEISSILANLSI